MWRERERRVFQMGVNIARFEREQNQRDCGRRAEAKETVGGMGTNAKYERRTWEEENRGDRRKGK